MKRHQFEQELATLNRRHDDEMESARKNHKRELQQLESLHSQEIELLKNKMNAEKGALSEKSPTSSSRHRVTKTKSKRMARAVFAQASIPPRVVSLAVGNVITLSTPAGIDRYLSHTNHFIANFAPRMFSSDTGRVAIPYSMMMDAAKQGQSRIITSTASELEEILIERLKRQKVKMQQTQEQFDNNYPGLSSSMKDAIEDVYQLCRGYRELINEQSQTINQLSSDFQDQLTQIVRTFRNTLMEMDSSYRRKLSQMQMLGQTDFSSKRPNDPIRRKKKELDSTEETELESFGSDAERHIRLWKRK